MREMNVQPIPTVSDRINEIRLLTAEIVNQRDPAQREPALGRRTRRRPLTDDDREQARELASASRRR